MNKSLLKHSALILSVLLQANLSYAQILPGTQSLTWEGDIASRLIDSCDAFLLREIDYSIEKRQTYWKRDFTSPEAYTSSVDQNRKDLARIIGVKEERTPFKEPEILGKAGETSTFVVSTVRWPVFGTIHGEGLLVSPTYASTKNAVVLIPDAGQTPEELIGLAGNLSPEMQRARWFAEKGIRVLIPAVINREEGPSKLSNREYLYRSSFELGRHIIGYEVQKILAGVDWFSRMGIENIIVSGWGEGALLAMYAAAIDTRIGETHVSGYFGSRQNIWQEPAYRNVFGLLEQFGDAEIASLIAPRRLALFDVADAPVLDILPGGKAKPARLLIPGYDEVES
ncbi:MAG: hypothetical protein OEY51_10470, partial [Cyclobacteriaceae bacterium]|nr:hypothetical protein [Cyclobacteriaceae bacterium]